VRVGYKSLVTRQDMEGKEREKTERLRFGRFWYRFPHGESGADVYDRMTIFEDHMIRDINAGRFSNNTSLVLVTHGLALRIFLMRCEHPFTRKVTSSGTSVHSSRARRALAR